MPHDIFISYSRRDLATVKPIKEELEAHNYSCWMDLSDIPADERNYKKRIIPAIRASRVVFLFFLSSASQTSENALKEIGFAEKHAKKRFVLIRFNDDEMTDDFFYDYQNANIIDWRKPEQKEKLLQDLQKWSSLPTTEKSPLVAGTVVECPICGKKNRPEETFRCRECGRDNLCCTHQNQMTYLCDACELALKEKEVLDWFQKGEDFLHGINGCRQDYGEAAEWYRKAADQGLAVAQNSLGWLYENGWGVSRDYAKAIEWYRKAADQGLAAAQNSLGWMCENGWGAPQDCAQAVTWYRKAELQGNANATYNLGRMYENGLGVQQDDLQAVAWYRKAADLGNQDACHTYGDLLFNGRLGVEKNVSAARNYYLKADQSNVWIPYNIGSCHLDFYKKTENVDDAKLAVKLIGESASAGVPWACVKLGDCHRDGIGVSRDLGQARKWYGKALDPKGLATYGDHGAVYWAKECLAKVSAELLQERIVPALGQDWTHFRLVSGVLVRNAQGTDVPLAGPIASDRGIFIGVTPEGLRRDANDSLPAENPAWPFAQSVSEHCGIPLDWFIAALVLPDSYPEPNGGLPFWAIRESNVASAMLNMPPTHRYFWDDDRQNIIRKLEMLPMSSKGAEKNALLHFEAPVPEWKDGMEMLEKIKEPSALFVARTQKALNKLTLQNMTPEATMVQNWLTAFPPQAGNRRIVRICTVSIVLRWCPPGISMTGFWMGETQVSQVLWTAVMGNNPSHFRDDERRPVETVSWDDCQTFLAKLNALDEIRPTGMAFRLPTAEEWEHACRAGSVGKYCRLADGTEITDASIDRVAWFDGNSDGTTHPVGRKEPNAWGLYDMHGNVGEWTQTAGDEGTRMERGGSCLLPADCCLSSGFSYEPPSLKIPNLGFRICASDRKKGIT